MLPPRPATAAFAFPVHIAAALALVAILAVLPAAGATAQTVELEPVDMVTLRQSSPNFPMSGDAALLSAGSGAAGYVLMRFDPLDIEALGAVGSARLGVEVSAVINGAVAGEHILLLDAEHSDWTASTTWNEWHQNGERSGGAEFARIQQGDDGENLGRHSISISSAVRAWRDGTIDPGNGLLIRYEFPSDHSSRLEIATHLHEESEWRPRLTVSPPLASGSGCATAARGEAEWAWVVLLGLILALTLARARVLTPSWNRSTA